MIGIRADYEVSSSHEGFRRVLARALLFISKKGTRFLKLRARFRVQFGVVKVQFFERIDNRFRYDQVCKPLMISRHDVPRRICGARALHHFFIGPHVFAPVLPLVHVAKVKLPILFGFVEPF
jgi:hypothetical protein